MPEIFDVLFEAGVIQYTRRESVETFGPFGTALLLGMIGMGIQPVLELVDGGNPGQNLEHVLQLCNFGAAQVSFVGKKEVPVIH